MSIFSKRLKQAMNEQGMTQSDIASKTGLGKSSISQYLSGKNIPNAIRMGVIADALDVSIAWLSGDIDKPESQSGLSQKLTPEQAAKLMGVGKQFVRVGLQTGVLPFGYAVRMPSGKFRYYISTKKFTEYTGIEV